MMVEHVGIVEMVKDKRREHKYIYDVFNYDDTNCLIFFIYHKHLFNVDSNYLKIRITLILMGKMVNIEMIYDK